MPPTEVLVPLRWADMDAYGHVNNVEFLRLLEQARVQVLPMWFPQGSRLFEQGIVAARHEIEYLVPLDYRPEPVVVESWITRIGGASFDLGYVVRDGSDPAGAGGEPVHYVLAETTIALYDLAAGVTRRMTPGEREGLAAHLGGPVPFRRRR